MTATATTPHRPAATVDGKRPKGRETWSLELEPTTDVLAELAGRRPNGQILVGFAAEHGEEGIERARAKLAAKRVDLVVFNDVSRDDVGFDATDNEVVLVSAHEERRVEKTSKERVASAILDEVVRLLGA